MDKELPDGCGDRKEDEAEVAGDRTDDYGLRRRLVGTSEESSNTSSKTYEYSHPRGTTQRLAREMPVSRESKQQQTTSRIILEGDAAELRQSHKLMKKSQFKPRSAFMPYRRSTYVKTPATPPSQLKVRTSILFRKWWTTADALRHEQGAHLIFAIRDFIVYLIFLAMLWMAAFGHQYDAHNYYAKTVSDVITKTSFVSNIAGYEVIENFEGIHSPTQIWGFVNSVLSSFFTEDANGNILIENILVGAPSMRQVRVKSGTCTTAPMFEDLYVTCYDYYSEENESKEPFGHVLYPTWKYVSNPGRSPSVGEVSTYGSGGYQMNFTRNTYFSQFLINELTQWVWMRLGTRAVIIDFTLYTPSTNLLLCVKLIFEVPPTGGVVTRSYFTTSKFLKFLTPWDFIVQSCEFILIVFTVYYTFEELQQIWLLREDYLVNWWNLLDLVIIILSYINIYYLFYRSWIMLRTIYPRIVLIRTSNYVNFDDLLDIQRKYSLATTLLIFAGWLKLFKFSSLYKSITLFLSALDKIKSELLTVMIMSLVIITGFALCGVCLFGSHVKQFHGFSRAFVSLICLYVGHFSFYAECTEPYPTLAPIYFSAYIILTVVFFFNVYVALIVYGFHCAEVAMELQPNHLYLSDLVWSFFTQILYFFRLNELSNNLKRRDIVTQNQEDYDAFCRILKRLGWQGREVELFVETYGLERGQQMGMDKLTDMYNELCLMTQLFAEVEGHNKIHEELEKIEKMYEICDQHIVDVMTKVDYLTNIIALRQKV